MKQPDKVVTYLRMTSPTSLRPGRVAPQPITLEATSDECRLKPIYDSLADDWGWQGWDVWKVGFTRPGRIHYVIVVDDQPAGLAKFIDEGEGIVQIDNFGLLPPFVGRGFGGEALTRVVETAWDLALSVGNSGFVWLNTCNWDHPHALNNYQARGFEIVHVEPVADSLARGYKFPARFPS